ncbi:hypothetical protein SeMB42_g00939 [Synchytrium endobioticum]|uniref:Uncharacterized protein n=1 Tax=Synchytrium endobioticum TaxID=286115 RepID=A0A507DQN6_9FUNG|nr:hypothetical protein SeMB42_g00939 [Synchytrium endobioticum]
MTKESCTVPSSMKTLPGQALVTTATSNRDLPEEQDVDCGRILAELTMVSERMCTLVDRTRMFYAMKVVQDLLPPVTTGWKQPCGDKEMDVLKGAGGFHNGA